MKRYFLGLLLAIGLIIFVIVLIVHHGGPSSTAIAPPTLESYANTDAVARFTIIGPITAPDNHNEIQITVGNGQTTFNLMQGYQGQVITSQSYTTSEASYDAFLHALDHAGFTLGSNASDLKDDGGYCSTGDRYIYEFIQNGKDLQRYWVTDCSGTPKTFNGNLALNEALFQAQVPNYDDLSGDANL